MRRPPILPLLLLAAALAACAPAGPGSPAAAGTIVLDTLRSPSLEGNPLGDSPAREVAVYLPPEYHREPERRFPVVYLLHGFDGDSRQFLRAPFSLAAALDSLIAAGAVQPLIVAMPDGRNRWGGSFFANSPATGRWGDFAARDLVSWLDREYRTVPAPEERAVAGWSMGGFAALSLAAAHPETFGAVYALSPCCLGPEILDDLGPDHPAWEELSALDDPLRAAEAGFHARLLLALGAVLSPSADAPLGVALPFGPSPGAIPRWRESTVEARASRDAGSLRRLRGVGFDAGAQDAFRHIPATARKLSAALTAAGVPHRYEEYPGTHGSGVPDRLRRVVLPFLGDRLAGRSWDARTGGVAPVAGD